ncbi:MAG: redoxin domain-containing protein [Steroidobacteraceae bacterium]
MNDTASPQSFPPAPELQTQQWFNTAGAVTIAALRGKVIVIEAFQMLCPGCVSHGLPQAARIHDTFDSADVVVLGLHTVFEHHAAMTPVALEAFLHEYRIRFPVGVDAPGDGTGLPRTMAAYRMQGTPTLLLIDRAGRLRAQHFGTVSDLRIGAEIMGLMMEPAHPWKSKDCHDA